MANGDTTITDMRAIDAYAITSTNETAQELQDRLEQEADEKYRTPTGFIRSVSIYLQAYAPIHAGHPRYLPGCGF